MYLNGIGVPEDPAKAKTLWEKAAMQGDAGAQFRLGYLYVTGKKIPKDLDKGREWLEKAAAQNELGAKDTLERLNSGKPL